MQELLSKCPATSKVWRGATIKTVSLSGGVAKRSEAHTLDRTHLAIPNGCLLDTLEWMKEQYNYLHKARTVLTWRNLLDGAMHPTLRTIQHCASLTGICSFKNLSGSIRAKFFANWIKKDAFGANAKTSVCEIWVRDKDLFLAMNKVTKYSFVYGYSTENWHKNQIWVPERNSLMTNVKTNDASKIGWKQEDRDRQVAEWGVQAPYILFSRHFKMNGMPRIPKRRWNEMVIYSQTQDALLLAFPMTSAQLEEKINAKFRPYAYQIQNWNIRIPPDTVADFQQNGDEWIRVWV